MTSELVMFMDCMQDRLRCMYVCCFSTVFGLSWDAVVRPWAGLRASGSGMNCVEAGLGMSSGGIGVVVGCFGLPWILLGVFVDGLHKGFWSSRASLGSVLRVAGGGFGAI